MRKLGAALVSGCLLSVASALVLIACHSNPDIKGANVPTVGSPTDIPTCVQVCNRLIALCGYAPLDCTQDDAGGYCDTQLNVPDELLCIGYGSLADDDSGTYMMTESCQAAWDCVNNPPANGYGGGDDDSGTTDDDSGDDTDSGDLDGGSE